MIWILGIVVVLLLLLVLAALWSLSRPLQEVSRVQVELRGLAERLGAVEQNQGSAGQHLTLLQSELTQARLGVSALQGETAGRATAEAQIADSLRRLEAIIAGTHSKGAAGENILDVVFSKLPLEWQVRDFPIGNKIVEFGLRLPNNRILPIDSKWPATDLVERLAACDDPHERQRLKDQIGTTVIAKAKEVRKYLDPNLTMSFGVAAVPDAVYDLTADAQVVCFEHNVVLVAHSMFIPYLLLVFQTVLKTSQDIDLEKLDAHLRDAEKSAASLQQELEGRFSRAITMLQNSKTDMSSLVSRIDSSLINVHLGAGHKIETTPPDPLVLTVVEPDVG